MMWIVCVFPPPPLFSYPRGCDRLKWLRANIPVDKKARAENRMPRWKKAETVYTLKVAHHPRRGSQVYLPKPLVERLGRPNRVSLLVRADEILLMPPKKAYAIKASETLDAFIQGSITRAEAGRILVDISTEPTIEEDDVLDDIFTHLILIDEPEGRGQLTNHEIRGLMSRLKRALSSP